MILQVNVSDDMKDRIDRVAKEIGLSRSALCAYFIGQSVSSYEKTYSILATSTVESLRKVSDEA